MFLTNGEYLLVSCLDLTFVSLCFSQAGIDRNNAILKLQHSLQRSTAANEQLPSAAGYLLPF